MKVPDQNKNEFAKILLRQGLSYREIQLKLRNLFGAGISNSTIKSLQDEIINIIDYKELYFDCKKELQLYKNLYNQLLEMINKVKN